MLRSSFLRGSYQCHWLVPIHIAFINLVSARLIFPQISHLKMSLAHAEHKLISSWDLLDVSLSILMFSAVSCMNFNLQVSFMRRKMCNYYVPLIIIYYKKNVMGDLYLVFLYLRGSFKISVFTNYYFFMMYWESSVMSWQVVKGVLKTCGWVLSLPRRKEKKKWQWVKTTLGWISYLDEIAEPLYMVQRHFFACFSVIIFKWAMSGIDPCNVFGAT